MNRDEALDALSRIATAWPHNDMPDATIELWVETLGNVDPGYGEAATNALIVESKYPPSIAEFVARARDFARRDHIEKMPELPAVKVPADRTEDWLNRIRKELGNIGHGGSAETHNGTNWQQCRKCGKESA